MNNDLYKAYRDQLAKEEAEIAELRQQLSAAQAKIDELMLEYCPEEMTNEQLAEYVTEPKL